MGNYIPTDGKVQAANHMVITNDAKHYSNVFLTFKVVFKVQHLVVTSYSVTSGSSNIVKMPQFDFECPRMSKNVFWPTNVLTLKPIF